MKAPLNVAPLLVCALLALGCSNSSTPSEVSAAQPTPAEAVPAPPSPAHVPSQAFVTSGPIIVENQLDVAAQREGVVAQLMADAGTPVKKGQLLALLDGRQVLADLEAARAKTRSIEADLKNWEAEAKVLDADYARAKKMWDAQLITQEQLDHARYKAESDQWDVKRVQENLINAQQTEQSLNLEYQKTHIAAPFDGIVARRYVRAGQSVAKDERLFWVTAVAPMRVKVTVPGRFVGQIKTGTLVIVSSAEGASDRHHARIIQVSPVVDPSSDTIEVLAELSGAASDLKPGMRANVEIPKLR
jgi:RND family efflux transporter MFP subunit